MENLSANTFWYYLSRTALFLLSVRGLQVIANAYKRRDAKSKAIPHAPYVPLLGSLPYLGQSPAQVIAKWHKQGNYGSIFRVKFGPMDTIVLNDYESIRECYVRKSHCFSGRQQNSLVVELWKGDGLLFLDYGDKWKSQNKFRHQAFRKLFEEHKLQQMAINESRLMVKALQMQLRGEFTVDGYSSGNYKKVATNCKKNGCICTSTEADSNWTCVDPNNFAYRASMNLNCRILFGRSFRRDETKYCDILADTPIKARKCSTAFMTAFLIPILRHIPPIRGIINEGLELRWATFQMIREIVDDHAAHFQGVDDNSDMIDMFIDRIVNKQGKDDDQYFTYSQLHALLFDIFTAGAETSATTLLWTLLYLAKYPDIQNELRCEIMEFISESDDTCMNNLSMLHLTRATIHEIIRLRPIVTLGIPRKVTQDCEVMGFKFTKGSIVMPNLWSVHHNQKDFCDHDVFNPRRYINEYGVFTQHDHVMGFAIGSRRCPGKPIAQCSLLCTLVQILRNFEFRLPKVWNAKTKSYETASFDFRGTNEQVLLTPEYWLQWKEIKET